MVDFSISTEDLADNVKVISLTGEIDLYNAPELKRELFGVISEGCKEVVVDFSDATFIDSTTLGVLVGGVKRLRMQEGRLSLVCDNKHITSVFEITGLDRVFPIYENRAEALKAMDSPVPA